MTNIHSAPVGSKAPPPADDRSRTKQHGVVVRDGAFGPEVGLVGSSKGNSGKGLSLVRGKVQVGEKKSNTVAREVGEEMGHSKKNFLSQSNRIKTQVGDKKVQGQMVHLKNGAKPDLPRETRPTRWVHHSQVEKYLQNRPEQKALLQEAKKQNLIKNRYPSTPRQPLQKSTSLNSSATAKTSPTRRINRSFSGKHR